MENIRKLINYLEVNYKYKKINNLNKHNQIRENIKIERE